METTRPAALSGSSTDTAQIAKSALRRLALDKLEPTPENYARAYRQASGESSPAEGTLIASLIERIVRGIERGNKGWTAARKKESLQRVLDGSRSDAKRLQQRLTQLVASWDTEPGDTPTGVGDDMAPLDAPTTASTPFDAGAALPWGRAVDALGGTVQQALPTADAAPHEIALALAALTARLGDDAATPERFAEAVAELEALCERAAPVLQHRHRLVDQLGELCGELTASLTDLA